MKILVTGAGGMLGADLADCLSGCGQVTGLGLRQVSHLKIPYQLCDLRDTQALNRVFKEYV